jgi:flagellar biosynthesis/type III secretory pathway protein FliH
MSDSKTASQQLADAQRAQEELAAKIEALLQQTREEDLATAKRLIKTHGFTATDLKPELKTRAVAKTPRKSAGRGRKRT